MGTEDDAGKPLTETDSNLTLTREQPDEGKASAWSILTCRSYFPKRYIVAVMALLGFCKCAENNPHALLLFRWYNYARLKP